MNDSKKENEHEHGHEHEHEQEKTQPHFLKSFKNPCVFFIELCLKSIFLNGKVALD